MATKKVDVEIRMAHDEYERELAEEYEREVEELRNDQVEKSE